MAQGEFALVRERLEQALPLSGQPVKRGTMAHEHIVHMMVVDSLAISEDGPGIAAHAPRLVELAERDGHQPYLAVAWRALGVAGRLKGEFAEAGDLLKAALDVFAERGTVWQKGRTLCELGKLELARGSTEQAEAFLTDALKAFEQIGAGPLLEQVRVELDKIGSPDQ